MARYIDANVLQEEIQGAIFIKNPWLMDSAEALSIIDMQPTADIVEVKNLTPCDACAYNPPSSCDGKPCTMCPAMAKMDGGKAE